MNSRYRFKSLIIVCLFLFFARFGATEPRQLDAKDTTSQINLNPPSQASVLLLGDILPGVNGKKPHWFDKKIKKEGFTSLFSEFSGLIKESDIVAG